MNNIRVSGIDIIGNIPWGTHFCQLYQTKEDLMDVLIPYFKAGLENNEFCIWIISEPLDAEEAKKALRKAIPDFDVYLGKGQIEIIPIDWYLKEGILNSKRVFNDWVEKLNQALTNGYDGLRLTEDIFWLEKENWNDFINYEKEIGQVIGNYQMLALCTYSLYNFSAIQIMDIVANHQFSLIEREGKWESMECSKRKKVGEIDTQVTQNSEVKLKEANDYLEGLVEEKTMQLREACKQLKGTKEDLAEVQKMAHIGNWKWDAITNELRWSDEVYRIFGLNPQEFEATFDSYFNYAHPDDRDYLKNAVKKAFEGEPYSIDNRIITASGEERIVHTDAEITFNEDNIPVYARGIVQDITECKRVEEALRESEERLRFALETFHIGVWDLDLVDHTAYRSLEHDRIFGYAELLPQWTLEMFLQHALPEYRAEVEVMVRKATAVQSGWTYECRIRRADGEIRWIWFSGRHYTDILGRSRVVGVVQDITERKRAEEELRDSEERFRNLFEVISSGVAVYDAIDDGQDFILKDMNPAGERIYHLQLEDNIGKSLYELFPSVGEIELDSAFRRVWLTGKMEVLPLIFYEDENITLWITKYIFRLPSGELVEVFDDITELKQIEEALKKARDSLEEKVKERTAELEEAYNSLKESERSLVEAQKMAHLGNWNRNIITGEVHWSEEMYRIFGFKPQELKSSYNAFLSYVHSDDRDYVSKAVKQALKGKPFGIDYKIVSADGKERIVHENVEVIFDEKNTPVQIRGTVQDITERKETEQALANLETARQKEIHHRIKNNLQVISSLLDLQAEKFNNRECVQNSEVLEAFRESQDRVLSVALIHEELHEGGRTDALNFSPYLQRLAESLFQTYRLGNANISLNLDLEENVFFDMDTAVPLGMIVNELVSNSLKHAFPDRDKGTIQIKLLSEQAGDELSDDRGELIGKSAGYTLIVSDDGAGIPENIDFENPNTLGMQLVTILVDQLEGEIELKRDEGTEFKIRFNVKQN